ncbi:LOW QUALITY PROTEIN: hypothetical protein PanWU01x14_009970 [Parasponia andersonii]|uniref:Uncharacterized protein n=1 Tax=Parasponia andersonii TaxID=3476 RepID=A0A2P5E2J6_PARAD|nr:LOW QUALITY PROTEIN: hypothetical protein PanWU01x14_009970 [Parasponia andersonii]
MEENGQCKFLVSTKYHIEKPEDHMNRSLSAIIEYLIESMFKSNSRTNYPYDVPFVPKPEHGVHIGTVRKGAVLILRLHHRRLLPLH